VCRVTTSLFVRVLAFAVFIGDASGLVRENKSRQLAWRDCQIYTRTYTVLLYPPAKGGPAKHVLRHRCTITIMQPCIILAASVKRMKATMRLKRRRRRTDGLPYYIEPLVRHPSGWFLDPHTHAEPNGSRSQNFVDGTFALLNRQLPPVLRVAGSGLLVGLYWILAR
jgi:hypothetical protein